MRTRGKRTIPAFRLYGEVAEITVPGFVHAERIISRAPLHDWEISTHRHAHLSLALAISQGSGVLHLDTECREFSTPWLVWIPVGVVHAFSFQPGTDGTIVSISDDFLMAVIEPDPEAARLREIADTAFSGAMGSASEIDLDVGLILEALVRTLVGSLPGSLSAVTALVKLLLVGVLRTRSLRSVTEPAVVAQADLHRRFRGLVEAHLRENWPVSRFAAELGVSADRLHAACTVAVGKAPQSLLHDRLMLEAKRNLLYTTLPVSTIAFDLGFNDPAYFSRFFANREGMSPAAYRKLNHTVASSSSGKLLTRPLDSYREAPH